MEGINIINNNCVCNHSRYPVVGKAAFERLIIYSYLKTRSFHFWWLNENASRGHVLQLLETWMALFLNWCPFHLGRECVLLTYFAGQKHICKQWIEFRVKFLLNTTTYESSYLSKQATWLRDERFKRVSRFQLHFLK